MSTDVKKEFRDIVKNSHLSFEQKTLWSHVIDSAREKDIEAIMEAIKDDPQNLKLLTENMRDKIYAFANQDMEAWKHIVTQEESVLKEYDE